MRMPAKSKSETQILVDRELVEALKSHLRANPRDNDALVALGLFLLSRGEGNKALECFNRVSRSDPKYPGIWRFKAKAFDLLGDKASADECRLRGSDPRS